MTTHIILLKNARAKCLDYTYKDTDKLSASKIDYPMFNIDLIWLLENFYSIAWMITGGNDLKSHLSNPGRPYYQLHGK